MSREIRVKVVSPLPARYFRHLLPDAAPVRDNCRFCFDPAGRDYDWLLVYEDIPPADGQPRDRAAESLACPASHTLLVTSEPASIKHYGKSFTRQFGSVLTSQPAWALPHADRVHSQSGLVWLYGVGRHGTRPFDDMVGNPPYKKHREISMVYSPKRQRHTLHHRRNAFMNAMMERVPGLDVFGRGAQPLEDDDKAAALDDYRYHIAIENHSGRHHWTEKLADAFLGMTLPFYYGCTNVTDYFPAESFIPIDIHDPAGAQRVIRDAVAGNEYDKRLPAIEEARRRVLHEHNLFALASREINRRHGSAVADDRQRILSRHALRKEHILTGLQDVYGKVRARAYHLVYPD